MKKKIEQSINYVNLISILILMIAISAFLFSLNEKSILIPGMFIIVFFSVLLFVITVLISKRIAESIVSPLSFLDINREIPDTYDELLPLLKQIKDRDNAKELALQIRREFSSNVSHELKTPLTSILGYSQMISGGLARDDDIVEFAEKIEHETEGLINLINDIIKLSHLEEEGFVWEKENINLFTLAREVCQKFAEAPNPLNVKIEVYGKDTVIYGNKTQLTELISNLVENALKYNRENGNVVVTVADGVLTVSDTGIGIPEKYYERIFERFFRVDKSRSKKVNGTGLGLSIVKHIAMSHNAKISISSKENKGTDICVIFPK